MTLWIARVCEEFHCLPSEAYREWMRLPDGTIEQVMEARAYVNAKHTIERAKTKADIPDGDLYRLASEIDLDLAYAELKAKEAALAAEETNG